MSAVCLCDLCGQIDKNINAEEQYCSNCQSVLMDMRSKIYERVYREVGDKYDRTATGQRIPV